MDTTGYEWVTHTLAKPIHHTIQQWFQDLYRDQKLDPEYLLLGGYSYRTLQREIAGMGCCCGFSPDLDVKFTYVLNQTTCTMVRLVQEDRLGHDEVMALYKPEA